MKSRVLSGGNVVIRMHSIPVLLSTKVKCVGVEIAGLKRKI
ncbi:hypothetical protein C4K20_2092 [Pseudomonas chlororaphis subsp. aurantiaca]|nr:hypothetical protein C4K20_2092 [Pseudomonas chlororaphis subsp. aurantiaca]